MDDLVARFAHEQWAVCDDFLPSEVVAALAAEARDLRDAGAFHRAGMGRGAGRAVREDIRGDSACWLDAQMLSPAQQVYWARMEALRQGLNEALFLGLFDLEAHFAVYPPGAYYRRHLDRFYDAGLRTVSCILYLSADWAQADGGQLRVYPDGESMERFCDVLPRAGRLAMFLSAVFYHEVLPARRERWSLTGWFRRRPDRVV